ncbi:MAG: CmcI family methyltransferase [Promethearchaeota archaeon]
MIKDLIWKKVMGFTVTQFERVSYLIDAVEEIVKNKIEGDFVECGIKFGGSCMAMDLALKELKEKRKIWMYDVFNKEFEDCPSEEEIRKLMKGVDTEIVVGNVLKTIPEKMPKKIALLRLDTNFFSSTYHELVHLYPLLEKGGILIIDDYGHWPQCKEAVDKYLEENNIKSKLNVIDYTGRWLRK